MLRIYFFISPGSWGHQKTRKGKDDEQWKSRSAEGKDKHWCCKQESPWEKQGRGHGVETHWVFCRMLLSVAVYPAHRHDGPVLAAWPCLFGSSLDSLRQLHSTKCPVCLRWVKVTWVLYNHENFHWQSSRTPASPGIHDPNWDRKRMVWRAFIEGLWAYSKPLSRNSCYKGNLFTKTDVFFLPSISSRQGPHICRFRALCNLMLAMLKFNTIWHLVITWATFPKW